jgi:hypothetical protein
VMDEDTRSLVTKRWSEYGISLGSADDGGACHIPRAVEAPVTSLTPGTSDA